MPIVTVIGKKAGSVRPSLNVIDLYFFIIIVCLIRSEAENGQNGQKHLLFLPS